METALTFNEVTLSPVTHENRLWIRASELARALGYSRENQVSRLYRSNADEFSPDMTQVIEITAEPRNGAPVDGRTRIFSPRGCHLIAMFARTKVAKAFRRWVLDVLDKVCQPEPAPRELPPADAPITPDQQCTLQAIVRAKVEALPEAQRKGRGLYAQAWSRFNNHFRIARYAQLPQSRLSEAVAYLTQMELVPPALPEAPMFPVPVEVEKALKMLHRTREFCRFDFMPGGHSANDRTGAQRARLGQDLYKLQDCLWAALYNVCSAAMRVKDWS